MPSRAPRLSSPPPPAQVAACRRILRSACRRAARAGAVRCRLPLSGLTVTSQATSLPAVSCRAPTTVPPVACSTPPATIVWLSFVGSALKCSSTVNSFVPSWFAGTPSKRAVGPSVLRPPAPLTIVWRCPSVAFSLVATLRIVPPFSTKLFAVTAIDMWPPSPATRVYANTSSVVPLPRRYSAVRAWALPSAMPRLGLPPARFHLHRFAEAERHLHRFALGPAAIRPCRAHRGSEPHGGRCDLDFVIACASRQPDDDFVAWHPPGVGVIPL